MPEPFYVTTPIYYVNDVPHIGHAYTTVTADALARWHRLLGDDVLFLTGTDEHGLKVQRSAEANGVSPQEQADRTSARFRETWDLLDIAYDDYIRTTEERHTVAVQAFMQAIHDNGWIRKGTYAGLYCVSCEAYYTEADLVDGNCPIHGRPVEWLEEDNWFFELSKFAQPLLDWYEANPHVVQPEGKRNEALGIIRQGLEDVSVSRTSISWGVPVPWDEGQVFYVWYDALINYATAIGYGADPDRFEAWWPAVHHLLGKDILRFHCVYWPAMCLAAGIEPPSKLAVHGFLLVGGEKMSKTGLNQIFPADLVADFGVDGFRHHFLRDNPFGPDGDFSYEGMVTRYNTDLANNLGNLLSRVATVVAKKCDGTGPAPSPGSPLAAVAAEAYADTVAGWEAIAPSIALEATWRLIGAANAHLEANEPWKMDPGPEVDAVLGDALEVLRLVAILASPAMPATCREVWRRIGLDGSPDDQRLPDAASWGRYPGGLPVEKGAPLFPRINPLRRAEDLVRWIDDHCHLDLTAERGPSADEAVAAARAEGVERFVTVGTDVASSRAAIALARGRDGVWATAGVHPHDAKEGWEGLAALLGEPEVVAVGECGLDYHYDHSPRAVQREAFAAQVEMALARDMALVVHTREAWDDTIAVLGEVGTPERTVIHCFTGGPREAERCLELGAHLSFSGIVTFPGAPEVREAAALCPLDRLLVETDSPFLAPVPHRGRPNQPAFVPLVGAAVAAALGVDVAEVAARTWANAAAVYRLPDGEGSPPA